MIACFWFNAESHNATQVSQGDPMFRVQFLPLSVCVKGAAEANVRARQAVSRWFPQVSKQIRMRAHITIATHRNHISDRNREKVRCFVHVDLTVI